MRSTRRGRSKDPDDEAENQTASLQVFGSDDALCKAIMGNDKFPDLQKKIDDTIAELENLDISDIHGLTPRQECQQLKGLAKWWLLSLRHTPLWPTKAGEREARTLSETRLLTEGQEELYDFRPMLPKLEGITDVGWLEELALVRPLANTTKDKTNVIFTPYGMRLAVLGNSYEPLIFCRNRAHTYTEIINWAQSQRDGGIAAAGQVLDCMDGKIPLTELDANLQMLRTVQSG